MIVSERLRPLVTGVLLGYTLIIPTVLAFRKLPAEAGLLAAAGCVLVALTNLNLFSSFKTGWFEATTREVEKVVKNGQATIDQLHQVGHSLAHALLVSFRTNGVPVSELSVPAAQTLRRQIDDLAQIRNALTGAGETDGGLKPLMSRELVDEILTEGLLKKIYLSPYPLDRLSAPDTSREMAS